MQTDDFQILTPFALNLDHNKKSAFSLDASWFTFSFSCNQVILGTLEIIMKKTVVVFFSSFLFSCDDLIDIRRYDGPCRIELKNGTVITTQEDIELLKSTGTITYRDENGKIWSLTTEEYETYSCGN
jgi:hypothetical protein